MPATDAREVGVTWANRLPFGPVTYCVLCGHTPAADVTLHRQQSVVVIPRWSRDKGPFCRGCGLSLFRDRTGTSLSMICLSLISVVLAPLAVFLNLRARRKLLRLAPPAERADVITPNRTPLPPSKPVLARPWVWLSPVVLASILFVIPLVAVPEADRYDKVGGCVEISSSRWRDEYRFVSCEASHQAVVTDVVYSRQECGELFVEIGYRYFCLRPRI